MTSGGLDQIAPKSPEKLLLLIKLDFVALALLSYKNST